MKSFIKTHIKTLLFFAAIGLIGGFFVGIYQLDSYPDEITQEIYAQGITKPILGIVSAIQSAGLGIVLGGLGIFLGKEVGLWRGERSIAKKPLLIALALSTACGIIMILADVLFFSHYSEAIADSYLTKPTVPYLIATVTYAAVIEEVLLRLFFMSLVAYLLYKIFEKGAEKPSTTIFIIANVVAALLFSLGHLPTTFILLGNSPLIIFRCFLLNGGIGLTFGYLYRKYGLRYSMIAHGGCHIVSKLIWILFI